MKTEKEVRAAIAEITTRYKHVLDCGLATIQINGARSLMQVEACALLSALYSVLGEKRPTFPCDDSTKVDR